jgi:hypothetical protein
VNPVVEAAVIAAASTGGVAVVGFITNLRATTRTLEAAREEHLWDKRAEVYAEILALSAYRQAARKRVLDLDNLSPDFRAGYQKLLDSYEQPSWFPLQGRVIAFASRDVQQAFGAARDSDEACARAQLASARARQAAEAGARITGIHPDDAAEIAELARAADKADSWLATVVHDHLTMRQGWRRRLYYHARARSARARNEGALPLHGDDQPSVP